MRSKDAALMVMALALSTGLVLGCGGSAARLQPEQVLSQVERVKNEQDRRQVLPAPSSQAIVGNARDYTVGPEDLLEVRLFGQNNLDRQVRVSGEGEITLPLVGEVKVAGLSPKSIEGRLQELYGANYLRNPQVSVAVREYRHQRVSVTGAVEKPGTYEIIGPRNLLEILAAAGGILEKGNAKAGDMVHIIRNQSAYQTGKAHHPEAAAAAGSSGETTIIDLKELLTHKTSDLNVPIRHGDVVHVPYAGNAYVVGAVRKPGSVAVRDNLSLSQALAMAGGVDPVLANNQVAIMRLDDQRQPKTITARLDKVFGKQEADVPLKDNDVVVVNVGNMKKYLYVFKQLLPGGSSTAAYRAVP